MVENLTKRLLIKHMIVLYILIIEWQLLIMKRSFLIIWNRIQITGWIQVQKLEVLPLQLVYQMTHIIEELDFLDYDQLVIQIDQYEKLLSHKKLKMKMEIV